MSTSTSANPRTDNSGTGNVQEELLKMLGQVGVAPPPPRRVAPEVEKPVAPAPAKVAKPAPGPVEEAKPKFETGCPDCGNQESWGSASWCPKCGYYPAIGRAGVVVEEVDENEIPDIGEMIPDWAWGTVGGMVGIAVLVGAMRYLLNDREGYLSLGSLVVLSFGAMLALFAHGSAVYAGLKFSNNVGPFSLIFNPVAVWAPVFKKLPMTSNLVSNLCWGVTGVVAAMTILGPIHMDKIREDLAKAEKAPPKKSVVGSVIGGMAQATAQMKPSGPQPANIEEAMESFAGMATGQIGLDEVVQNAANGGIPGDEAEGSAEGGLATNLQDVSEAGNTGKVDPRKGNPIGSQSPGGKTSPASTTPATPADANRHSFAVYGYLMNGQGEIRSLLLAHEAAGRGPIFAARLDVDDINATDRAAILELMAKIRTNRSYVRSPYNGAWVVPKIVLDVSHAGWSNNIIKEPNVTSWSER